MNRPPRGARTWCRSLGKVPSPHGGASPRKYLARRRSERTPVPLRRTAGRIARGSSSRSSLRRYPTAASGPVERVDLGTPPARRTSTGCAIGSGGNAPGRGESGSLSVRGRRLGRHLSRRLPVRVSRTRARSGKPSRVGWPSVRRKLHTSCSDPFHSFLAGPMMAHMLLAVLMLVGHRPRPTAPSCVAARQVRPCQRPLCERSARPKGADRWRPSRPTASRSTRHRRRICRLDRRTPPKTVSEEPGGRPRQTWIRELPGRAQAERRDKVPLIREPGGCESPMSPGRKASVG